MTYRIKKQRFSSVMGIGNTYFSEPRSLKSGFTTANRYKYFLHLTHALALNVLGTI